MAPRYSRDMSQSLMPPLSPVFWMQEAKLSGRPCVSTSASPAAATPPILVRCSIHTIILAQQVAHPAVVQHSSWLGNAIWPSVATKEARFASQAPGAEPTASSQPTALSHIPESSQSNSRSTILDQLPPLLLMLPSPSRQLQVKTTLILARRMSRLRLTAVPSPTIRKGYASEL